MPDHPSDDFGGGFDGSDVIEATEEISRRNDHRGDRKGADKAQESHGKPPVLGRRSLCRLNGHKRPRVGHFGAAARPAPATTPAERSARKSKRRRPKNIAKTLPKGRPRSAAIRPPAPVP